jgi:anti-anti-sigma factor
MELFYWSGGSEDFLVKLQSQLEELVSQHESKTLAIDMTPVNFLPSSFLGLLTSLAKTGLRVELLHVSATVRDSLETTKLDQFFSIRD